MLYCCCCWQFSIIGNDGAIAVLESEHVSWSLKGKWRLKGRGIWFSKTQKENREQEDRDLDLLKERQRETETETERQREIDRKRQRKREDPYTELSNFNR